MGKGMFFVSHQCNIYVMKYHYLSLVYEGVRLDGAVFCNLSEIKQKANTALFGR